MALRADAEVNEHKALRSILGSTDEMRVKLQRMTLLAAEHEKIKGKTERIKRKVTDLARNEW